MHLRYQIIMSQHISFATIVSPKLAFQQKEKEKDSRYEAETDGYS